jgi:hypothetical protein
MVRHAVRLDACPCSQIYRISESVHPQQSNPPAATLDAPLVPCAPRLKGVEKSRISLTQPRPMDRRGSGRATFVAVMQAADLRKCDDLASHCVVELFREAWFG